MQIISGLAVFDGGCNPVCGSSGKLEKCRGATSEMKAVGNDGYGDMAPNLLQEAVELNPLPRLNGG